MGLVDGSFFVFYIFKLGNLQDPDGFDPTDDGEFQEKLSSAVAIRDAYSETAGMASKLCKPKGGRRSANKAISVWDTSLIGHHPKTNQSSDMY